MKRGETMAVAYNCKKCGKEHVEPLHYQGSIQGMVAYIDRRLDEITAKCCGEDKEEES